MCNPIGTVDKKKQGINAVHLRELGRITYGCGNWVDIKDIEFSGIMKGRNREMRFILDGRGKPE